MFILTTDLGNLMHHFFLIFILRLFVQFICWIVHLLILEANCPCWIVILLGWIFCCWCGWLSWFRGWTFGCTITYVCWHFLIWVIHIWTSLWKVFLLFFARMFLSLLCLSDFFICGNLFMFMMLFSFFCSFFVRLSMILSKWKKRSFFLLMSFDLHRHSSYRCSHASQHFKFHFV